MLIVNKLCKIAIFSVSIFGLLQNVIFDSIVSISLFGLLHNVIIEIISKFLHNNYDKNSIKSVELYLISLIHSCIATYHGFKYTNSLYIKNFSDEEQLSNYYKFYIVSIGYYIYDMIASLLYIKNFNFKNAFNHFSLIIIGYIILSNPNLYSITPPLMITELSTIFLNIVLIMSKLKLDNNYLYRISVTLLVISFFVTRLLWLPIFTFKNIDSKQFNLLGNYKWLLCLYPFFNIVWFKKIFSLVKKETIKDKISIKIYN